MERQVTAIIAKQAKLDPVTLTRQSIIADSNIDSLDIVEIVFLLEDTFDISIPYNAADLQGPDARFRTAGDLVDMVVALVAQKGIPAQAT